MAKTRAGLAKIQKAKREYISQSDIPSCSLDQALRVPTAIVENYAGKAVTPLQLAHAMLMSPTSGPFRQFCGASIAYGLTEGGYNANEVGLTSLGKRVLRPLEEHDDVLARREAILKPRVIREFLEKYRNAPLPRQDIAFNVLHSMGIPREKTESVYSMIIDGAQSVGFIRDIKGKQYVDLSGVGEVSQPESTDETSETSLPLSMERIEIAEERVLQPKGPVIGIAPPPSPETQRRVFITHGKNREFIEPIKRLLGFGELIPVVSVERQSVSKPVPDKVMDDMRSCSAAIIHVDSEQTLIDRDAVEHVAINPNVLLEIGAAMALYGRRFILLVREGVRLPSNLQGLFEVRYSGEALDGNATIRLLEAINDMKKNSQPQRPEAPVENG